MRMYWLLPALLIGCSDYSLGNKTKAPNAVDTGEGPTTPVDTDPGDTDPVDTDPADTDPVDTDPPDTDPPEDTGPPADTGEPPPPPSCDGFNAAGWTWWASASFAEEADPVDAAGEPFYSPSFSMAGWSSVMIPDRGIPAGFDRAYRATFTLSAMIPALHLDLQSDDGIHVWLNGHHVGHWGGDWQEEGCVNENAECVFTIAVPPVDVTPWLVVGTNTLAARVSNPVQNSWFEIVPSCVD